MCTFSFISTIKEHAVKIMQIYRVVMDHSLQIQTGTWHNLSNYLWADEPSNLLQPLFLSIVTTAIQIQRHNLRDTITYNITHRRSHSDLNTQHETPIFWLNFKCRTQRSTQFNLETANCFSRMLAGVSICLKWKFHALKQVFLKT